MTPDAGLTAQIVGTIIDKLGATPILLFLAILLLGPWAALIWISRSQGKRFEEVVEMYKSNVQLVKNYESFTTASMKISESLQDLVILTTSTMQTLVDHIKSNLFCPMMKPPARQEKVKEPA